MVKKPSRPESHHRHDQKAVSLRKRSWLAFGVFLPEGSQGASRVPEPRKARAGTFGFSPSLPVPRLLPVSWTQVALSEAIAHTLRHHSRSGQRWHRCSGSARRPAYRQLGARAEWFGDGMASEGIGACVLGRTPRGKPVRHDKRRDIGHDHVWPSQDLAARCDTQ